MGIGEAIKKWREVRDISQERLANLSGLSRQTIYHYEAGKRVPGLVELYAIALALGASSVDALRQGPPPSWAQPQHEGIVTERDFDAPRDVHTREVELYETVPAGGWSADAPERTGTATVLRHLVRRDGYVVVRISGDSMWPSFLDGDLVLVDTVVNKPRSGQVVAAIYQGTTTMKRYRRIGGKPVLVADNPQWPPIEVDNQDELRILGVVVRIIDRDVSRAG